METKINVAKILKDKPKGTKLYSSACGKCELKAADDKSFKVSFYSSKFGFMNGGEGTFDKNGNLYDDGECVVFPSKEMRDWSKFAWKRGDVLISDCGFVCIFKEWASDDYTRFNGCYFDGMPNAETAKYSKLDNNTAYGYIREIENRCGGKLNLETLEIEKQNEFKDGDIVTMHKKYCDIVFIFNRLRTEGSFYYYAFHALQTNNTGVIDCHTTLPCAWTFFEGKMNFATDSEKQQLFGALAKEGKAWDSEKKQVVELKHKIEFKPFDKVLCRDNVGKEWHIDLFESMQTDNSKYNYKCMANIWKYCIPYEGNESLFGTTKDVED
nr:MAG TPA: hypothetical protein [Bacteriophage sp.]